MRDVSFVGPISMLEKPIGSGSDEYWQCLHDVMEAAKDRGIGVRVETWIDKWRLSLDPTLPVHNFARYQYPYAMDEFDDRGA